MSVPIPGIKDISKLKFFYGFKYLWNPTVYNKIFDKLDLTKTYKHPEELKVLDLYPGVGIQSAIFYNKYCHRQYSLLEKRSSLYKFLNAKFEGSPLQILKRDPYDWSTYSNLIDEERIFVPEVQSSDHINDKFLTVANVTGEGSEGLIMQWLSCIGNKNWLYRFGKVKMLLWMPSTTARKLLARPGMHSRSKCSVVREAFTDTKLIAISDANELKGFDSQCIEEWDPILFSAAEIWPTKGKPIALVEMDPIDFDFDVDNWDYVTRHLMILKRTPLNTVMDSLGHGGQQYFNSRITDKDLLKKRPIDLTNDEFIYLTKLFMEWPFKPDILMDFVDMYQTEHSG